MRDRKLQVISRHTAPRRARASAVGYKKCLYDVDKDFFSTYQGRAIDNLWDAYEPNLPTALDALIDGNLTASDWVRVIVVLRSIQPGCHPAWVFDVLHADLVRLEPARWS